MLRIKHGRNRGTHVNISECASRLFGGKIVLRRAFFAFDPCITAFWYCCLLICVDGMFLTGRYKGQILITIVMDGNNLVLPVALAFVESENTDSWLWFLRQVKVAIMGGQKFVSYMIDMAAC